MTNTLTPPCNKCGSIERRPRGNCANCHRQAAQDYRARKKNASGTHSPKQWREKAAKYDSCPVCKKPWNEVERPNSQKLPYTKGHITPLAKGGSDAIENLQPECAKCNYSRY